MGVGEKIIEKLVHVAESVLALLLLLMVLNVSSDVAMRYFFHNSSVAMQELEWHLFAIITLLGISVGLKEEAHVRVDFLFERFGDRVKAVNSRCAAADVARIRHTVPVAGLPYYGGFFSLCP